LRAGEHTSEWAYDRPDIRARIRHQRAPLATSYPVTDAEPKFEAHDYVCSFELPATAVIVGGEIVVVPAPAAPRLSLTIGRMSFIDGDRVLPLRKEAITIDSSQRQNPSGARVEAQPRWKHVADVGPIAIFENHRVLPRAWLASSERVAPDEQQLQIIRTGKTSPDAKWDPLSEALVTNPTGIVFPKEKPPPGQTEVTRLEPGRVVISTESGTPSLLVLADNFYPGWRADVDGRRALIHRVNYNQRGVAVDAGKHTVTFVYAPGSVLLGLFVSGFSLVLLLWWMNSQPRQSQP
jgi:hypothetical protein